MAGLSISLYLSRCLPSAFEYKEQINESERECQPINVSGNPSALRLSLSLSLSLSVRCSSTVSFRFRARQSVITLDSDIQLRVPARCLSLRKVAEKVNA